MLQDCPQGRSKTNKGKAKTRQARLMKQPPRPPRATSRTSARSRRAWVPRVSATGQAERRSPHRASSNQNYPFARGRGSNEPRPPAMSAEVTPFLLARLVLLPRLPGILDAGLGLRYARNGNSQ